MHPHAQSMVCLSLPRTSQSRCQQTGKRKDVGVKGEEVMEEEGKGKNNNSGGSTPIVKIPL